MERDDDFDWAKEVHGEKLARLKGDINLMLARLETAPSQLADASDVTRSGPAFMAKNGKPAWRRYDAALCGDQLTFARPGVRLPRRPLRCSRTCRVQTCGTSAKSASRTWQPRRRRTS